MAYGEDFSVWTQLRDAAAGVVTAAEGTRSAFNSEANKFNAFVTGRGYESEIAGGYVYNASEVSRIFQERLNTAELAYRAAEADYATMRAQSLGVSQRSESSTSFTKSNQNTTVNIDKAAGKYGSVATRDPITGVITGYIGLTIQALMFYMHDGFIGIGVYSNGVEVTLGFWVIWGITFLIYTAGLYLYTRI